MNKEFKTLLYATLISISAALYIPMELWDVHRENSRIVREANERAAAEAQAAKERAAVEAQAAKEIAAAEMQATNGQAATPPPISSLPNASQSQKVVMPAEDIAKMYGISYWDALRLKDKWNQEAASGH